MLTNEIVLKVFEEYLKADDEYEVVLTSRGYTVMGWEPKICDWRTSVCCPTPETLRDALLEAYTGFAEVMATGGDRDLTDAETLRIESECRAFIEECEREASR